MGKRLKTFAVVAAVTKDEAFNSHYVVKRTIWEGKCRR